MQAFFPGILAVCNRIMVSIRSSLNTPQVFDVSSALGGGCMGRTELDTLWGLISTHQGRKIPSLICWLCSCSYRLGCCGLSCCLVCCWLAPSWLPSTSPQGLFCRAAPLAQEHSTALVPAEPLSPSVLLLLFWVIPQFGNSCLIIYPFSAREKQEKMLQCLKEYRFSQKCLNCLWCNLGNILTTWGRKLTRSLLLCSLLKCGGKSVGKIWKMRYRHENLWSV